MFVVMLHYFEPCFNVIDYCNIFYNWVLFIYFGKYVIGAYYIHK